MEKDALIAPMTTGVKKAWGFLRDGIGVLLFVFPLFEPWIKPKVAC